MEKEGSDDKSTTFKTKKVRGMDGFRLVKRIDPKTESGLKSTSGYGFRRQILVFQKK